MRVLVVEDDSFTRTAVLDALETAGYDTLAVPSVADALISLSEFDPHAVCADLHLGDGPSGIAFLRRVAKERPWVGRVILTSHMSVEAATGEHHSSPPGTIMLVKATLNSLVQVGDAVRDSIAATNAPRNSDVPDIGDGYETRTLSRLQAEILSLVAAGYTNTAIARRRNMSLRSVEMIVTRSFRALGVQNGPEMNSRVLAMKMWQSGRIIVR